VKGHLRDLGVDGKILKRKQGVRMRTEFLLFRVGAGDGILNMLMKLRVPQERFFLAS
jgi:hypothetical protein